MTVTRPPTRAARMRAPKPGVGGGTRKFLWDREEYVRAVDDGAFGDRTVELLEGEVYEKMAEHHPHRQVTRRLVEALRAVFGGTGVVQAESGIPMGRRSQPKPDVSVLRGVLEDYDTREEGPEDVALVVEVVDSRRDTAQKKVKVYGAAGVPEYWILDLRTRTLVVHREPHAKGYASVERFGEEASVAPLEHPDSPVAVADLLP